MTSNLGTTKELLSQDDFTIVTPAAFDYMNKQLKALEQKATDLEHMIATRRKEAAELKQQLLRLVVSSNPPDASALVEQSITQHSDGTVSIKNRLVKRSAHANQNSDSNFEAVEDSGIEVTI
jgi:hypothetical protein